MTALEKAVPLQTIHLMHHLNHMEQGGQARVWNLTDTQVFSRDLKTTKDLYQVLKVKPHFFAVTWFGDPLRYI